MYGKVFATIFSGSMRGQSDILLVFINMISTCDQDGVVDKVPQAISEETGLSSERVDAAIKVLESPDPMSRSPEHEGRRIERLSSQRLWGWKILNYEAYRTLNNQKERRQYMRGYMADYRKGGDGLKPVGYDEAQIIYANYPRKIGKPAAIAKIMIALRKESPTFLLERTKAFSSATSLWPENDRCFIPHPATWFHQNRYNDDPKEWIRNGGNGTHDKAPRKDQFEEFRTEET